MNDLHGPFEDTEVLSLVLDILQDISIDKIILNGDILDFLNLSFHGPKSPDLQATLEHEIDWGLNFYQSLRKKFPKIPIVNLLGNHEERLNRFIVQCARPFWNILKLEDMFQWENLGIEWQPYQDFYQIDETRLFVVHSPPSYSENAAMTSLKKHLDASFIYGCTHRADRAVKSLQFGDYVEVIMNGWLGSTNLTDQHHYAFKYPKGHQNWQQCFTLTTVSECGSFHNQQVLIRRNNKGRPFCSVDGFLYVI